MRFWWLSLSNTLLSTDTKLVITALKEHNQQQKYEREKELIDITYMCWIWVNLSKIISEYTNFWKEVQKVEKVEKIQSVNTKWHFWSRIVEGGTAYWVKLLLIRHQNFNNKKGLVVKILNQGKHILRAYSNLLSMEIFMNLLNKSFFNITLNIFNNGGDGEESHKLWHKL